MTQATNRRVKDSLFEQFARIPKALASPKRIELLDLLCQAPYTVEALARATGMGVTNTSAHLQALRAANLVVGTKDGTRVRYRIANDEVVRFIGSLRDLARGRLAEVEQIARGFFDEGGGGELVGRQELVRRLEREDVLVIDVRPHEEYLSGHIPGAISLPVAELAERLHELPAGTDIVAYCRGPYCVYAPEALRILGAKGIRARRLEDGYPEWGLAGLPTVVGAS